MRIKSSTVVRVIVGLLLLLGIKECYGIFYVKMTHLTPDELEWVKNKDNGRKKVFRSDSGTVSYLEFSAPRIFNKTNPFYISSNSGWVYEALALYEFSISDLKKEIEGYFQIKKLSENDSLGFSFAMGNKTAGLFNEKTLPIETFDLKGHRIDNCIIIDSTRWHLKPYPEPYADIKKLVISKRYGPIYYKLGTGEEFFRQFK